MKILNIITDTNIGGAGMVLLNFMRNTDRKEFDHAVALPQGAGLAPLLRGLDIQIIEMDGIAYRSLRPGAIAGFRRLFERMKPDLIHTHASLSARIAGRVWDKNCAIVHTRHCAYPQGRLRTSFPARQALGYINNHMSDVIIAISPAARDNLVDTGTDPKRIVTMFNGVEPVRQLSPYEKRAAKASLGISDGQFVCAIIARLVPEKGHKYILEAAGLLKGLPISFIIAGAGPQEQALRAEVSAKGLDNCIFTGFVSDIAEVENITDLQLNASYGTETSCLAVLEGMSLSTPAVVSDFGGNPHLVTNGLNGVVVPTHSGAAIAEAIRRLYEDPEGLAGMGAAALRIYNERFTAQIMTANIENVYRAAVNERTGQLHG